jgi:UPF0755 protein
VLTKFSNQSKLILLSILIVISWNCSNREHTTSKRQMIVINSNETGTTVVEKLKENDIIQNTKTFLFWAKILGYDRKIKSGRYYLAPNSNVFDVLKILNQGGENKALITIPEGYTMKDIARLLETEGVCKEKAFIKACADTALLNSLQLNKRKIEGYLFPDSYDFVIPSEPEEIIQRMVKRFWQVFSETQNLKVTRSVILSRAKNLNSIDTIVTIASLVEKEAKLDQERPIIASVFYNRLKSKMPLQSCATVQYILPNHKEQLSVEDTKLQSPYNTYLYPGLPPTPICNPGKASLQSALKPAQTKFLYFAVDKNDKHHFSNNFSEHQHFLRNKK